MKTWLVTCWSFKSREFQLWPVAKKTKNIIKAMTGLKKQKTKSKAQKLQHTHISLKQSIRGKHKQNLLQIYPQQD